jgi:hypothetical protein
METTAENIDFSNLMEKHNIKLEPKQPSIEELENAGIIYIRHALSNFNLARMEADKDKDEAKSAALMSDRDLLDPYLHPIGVL